MRAGTSIQPVAHPHSYFSGLVSGSSVQNRATARLVPAAMATNPVTSPKRWTTKPSAIEQLNDHDQIRVGCQREQKGARSFDGEPAQQQRLAPPHLRPVADPRRQS